MNAEMFYYGQVDLLCIGIMLFGVIRAHFNYSIKSVSFNRFAKKVIILSVLDLCLYYVRYLDAAPIDLNVSPLVTMFTIIFNFWLLFLTYNFAVEVNSFHNFSMISSRRNLILMSLPFWIVGLMVLATPFVGSIFVINRFHQILAGPVYWIFPTTVAAYNLLVCVQHGIDRTVHADSQITNFVLDHRLFFVLWNLLLLVFIQADIFFSAYPFSIIGFTLCMFFVLCNLQTMEISRDNLTGLNNRAELNNYLNKLWSADQGLDGYCLMFLDVNAFKSINDDYGHAMGDRVLKEIAMLLSDIARQKNLFVCRYGGDEFVYLFNAKGDDEYAKQIVALIEERVEQVNLDRTFYFKLSVSIGYVFYQNSFEHQAQFLSSADEHMYRIKKRQHQLKDNVATA